MRPAIQGAKVALLRQPSLASAYQIRTLSLRLCRHPVAGSRIKRRRSSDYQVDEHVPRFRNALFVCESVRVEVAKRIVD